jgi:hypothetical protein
MQLLLFDIFSKVITHLRPARVEPNAKVAPRLIQRAAAAPRLPIHVRTKKPSNTKGQRKGKYDHIISDMLSTYGIRVRKWRTTMSGIAWELYYRDGTTSRLIESPYPKTEMSLAIFLHEIGHHAIGFKTYKPRCLEEFKAWEFSMNTMRQYNIVIPEKVHYRMRLSLWYAVAKANRRGLRALPPELTPYLHRPPRPTSPTRPT